MINAGCLSRHACDLNSSCLRQLQTGAIPIIPHFADCTHLTKKKLCFQWKKASKTCGYPLAAAQTALTFEEKNIEGDVQDNWWTDHSEDEKEIDPKEAQRRMKIRKGNMGKTPWNKGMKTNPETLALIKERTKQALQNPKIKLKAARAQHARAVSESKEKKEEICAILRRAWEVRRKRSLLQQTCMVEWKESIAELARRGGDGEDELHWDSYYILSEDIHQEWLQATATEKLIQKEHRQKMAELNKAKRADLKNMMTGMKKAKRALQETCMVEWKESIAESARRGGDGEDELHWDSYYTLREDIHQEWLRAIATEKPIQKERRQKVADPKNVMTRMKKAKKSNRLMVPETCDIKREKPSRPRNQLPYSDPQAGAKLQMIKRIRADRAAMELEKKEAMEQAMLLIAEAVKAAKALESAATVDTSVQSFYFECCRLIDEAIHSMQIAESGKSTDSPMLERDFNRLTYRDIHFMDRSEVADPAMPDSDDNYGVRQPSLSKSRQICENILLAHKSETNLRSEISRSLYCDSYESNHPISSPQIGSLEAARSINSSTASELEGTGDKVSEQDAMFSVARNSVVESTILIDKQDNPDWKGDSRPAENITKDIISSIASILHNMNLFLTGTKCSIHDTDEKSGVTPFQTEKYRKKKWVQGRLIEVEED